MKRSALKRKTPFQSAFVRHSPFQNGIKRKDPVSAVTDAENALSEPQTSGIKPARGLKAIGKKGNEWLEAKKWLKRHFGYRGITFCEARLRGCLFDDQLSWAHCRKRRKLLEGEIYHVALLCIPCHSVYERMSHEDMHEKIHDIIDARGLIAP